MKRSIKSQKVTHLMVWTDTVGEVTPRSLYSSCQIDSHFDQCSDSLMALGKLFCRDILSTQVLIGSMVVVDDCYGRNVCFQGA